MKGRLQLEQEHAKKVTNLVEQTRLAITEVRRENENEEINSFSHFFLFDQSSRVDSIVNSIFPIQSKRRLNI